MIFFKLFHQTLIFVFFFFVSILIGHSQNSPSEEISNEIFDRNIIVDNPEIKFEICDTSLYKTTDSTHMFYGDESFVNGIIYYKNEVYRSKLKYDLLNDLAIISFYDDHKNYILSLDSDAIDQFEIDDHKIIKLPKSKDLKAYYDNGYFETIYDGASFSFFIKHQKKLRKNKDRTNVIHSFWEETIYLFEYDNHYYRINNKRDIIKATPHFKKEINDFFGRYRKIDLTSLMRLFIQLDSINQEN